MRNVGGVKTKISPELSRFRKQVRHKTLRLVATGKIIKKDVCDCGNGPTQAHHLDYADPSDVQWLCRPCHVEAHRLIVTGGIRG